MTKITLEEVLKKVYKEQLPPPKALTILITILESTNDNELRLETLKAVKKLKIQNNELFALLENLIVSDFSEYVRALSVEVMIALFPKRSIPSLKWAVEKNKSGIVLLSLIKSSESVAEGYLHEFESMLMERFEKNYKELIEYGINSEEALIIAVFIATSKKIQIYYGNFKTDRYIPYKIFPYRARLKFALDDRGHITRLELRNADGRDMQREKILNQFSESFLSQFCKLEHLRTFRVIYCGKMVTKIPQSIHCLKNLEELDFSGNEIKEIPKTLGSLRNLERLDLSYNLLRFLPKSMKNLKKLKVLDLNYNKFDHIPEEISSLTNLRNLKISTNDIRQIPKWVVYLPSIERIYLGLTKIDEVPEAIRSIAISRGILIHAPGLVIPGIV